jgi:hypothetical protein
MCIKLNIKYKKSVKIELTIGKKKVVSMNLVEKDLDLRINMY